MEASISNQILLHNQPPWSANLNWNDSDSGIWHLSKASFHLITNHLSWQAGNGKNINAWEDKYATSLSPAVIEQLSQLMQWPMARGNQTLFDLSLRVPLLGD